MRHRPLLLIALATGLTWSACAELGEPAQGASGEGATLEVAPEGAKARVAHAPLVDPLADNWFAAGGAMIERIGLDGEPDAQAGRLVNGNAGALAMSANVNGLIVAGRQGKTAFLDAVGAPQRGDLRDVLMGQRVRAVAAGEVRDPNDNILPSWLAVGDEGRAQLLDAFAEPTATQRRIFTDATLTSAAFSALPGGRRWLVGADDGRFAELDGGLQGATRGSLFAPGQGMVAIIANPNVTSADAWLMLTQSQFTYYPLNPSVTTLEGDVTLTTATISGDQLALGNAQGQLALLSFDAMSATPSWVDVLPGQAVRALARHEDTWLVAGDAGQARLFDSATGAPRGDARRIGDGTTITSALWSEDRWLLGTESSLLISPQDDLSPRTSYLAPLDGATVLAAAASADGVLVAGEQGRYRLVADDGQALGEVQALGQAPTLWAASWSGSQFLIAGEGGAAQRVNAQGAPAGASFTLLDGEDARAIAWSGTLWLVGSAQGKLQRVRSDGALAGASIASGLDAIYGARWNGGAWMVVGELQGRGAYRMVNEDGSFARPVVTLPALPGALYAVDWSGREWLVGGQGGQVQVISAEGEPRTDPAPMPRDVLNGVDIHAINFHRGVYLIGGARGLARRMRDNLLLLGEPVSTLNFETIHALLWTQPRGFSGAECLSVDACYNGPCVGGSFQEGTCCDRACDRPCEGCEQAQTGVADGTCAPLLVNTRPSATSACPQGAEVSCGYTGRCDGAGECQRYDASVTCQAATCSAGVVTPAGSCDGQGACVVAEGVDCAPYASCAGSACPTSCVSTNDCVEGYRCVNDACVATPAPPATPPRVDEGDDDEGGCAMIGARAPSAAQPALLLTLALVGVAARRRRRA